MQFYILLLLVPFAAQDDDREPIESPKPAPAVEGEVARPEPPPEADILKFQQRDFEGRWIMWETELTKPAEKKTQWVAWLADNGHFDILEWNTLVHNDWAATGNALVSADAPQWPRVALRMHTSSDSHGWGGAKTALEGQPDLALSWLTSYPEKLVDKALEFSKTLEEKATRRVDTSKYLPPVEDEMLFGALESAGQPVDFIGHIAAQPGVLYVHQVKRSIDALSSTSSRAARWMKALFRQTTSENDEIRRAAYVAYSHFQPREIPMAEFRAVVHDPEQKPGTRAAALVAFSYGPDYPVHAELLSLLRDPEHPAWSVTVTRLGELGDALTVRLIDRVPALAEHDARHALLASELTRIKGRVPSNGQIEAETLRRIAWARVTDHELADVMEREGLEAIRSLTRVPEVRDRVRSQITEWQPAEWLDADVAAKIREQYALYADRVTQ